MSRPAVAAFVDSFFTRTLFQTDDTIAAAVLATELAPDASININGASLTSHDFVNLIIKKFRPTCNAAIIEIKDLNIATTNELGSTGVVGQWTAYETKGKEDGKNLKQSATTIVKVEERAGSHVVTGIWEAQTVDGA